MKLVNCIRIVVITTMLALKISYFEIKITSKLNCLEYASCIDQVKNKLRISCKSLLLRYTSTSDL